MSNKRQLYYLVCEVLNFTEKKQEVKKPES